MAGLPLKSGADFYNLEAARMRLHNLGADPTEVGAGLIYFNTSTGLNTSQKARLYTGSAWKTIAFSEDLDVASNADFLALKERVDLLSGDVDTDAIISNMKEVSAFLEGFAEDASLMDLLNGKLNTSGGTITGNIGALKIKRSNGNSSAIHFQNIVDNKDNDLGGLGFGNDGKPYVFSPDYSTKNEILTSAGGTISNTSVAPLIINTSASDSSVVFRINSVSKTQIGYNPSLGSFIYNYSSSKSIGIKDDGTPHFNNNTLIHSGNIGSYKAGDSDKLGGLEASGYAKNIKDLKNDLANIDASPYGLYGGKLQGSEGTFPTIDGGYEYGAFLSFGWHGYGVQISSRKHKTWLRASENGTYSDWKQIAFTDSNVASAQALTHSNGTVGATVDASGNVSFNGAGVIQIDGKEVIGKHSSFYVGYQTAVKDGLATRIWGKGFQFSNEAGTHRMLINESGNVTIGASDLAGTKAKLYVDGSLNATGLAYLSGGVRLANATYISSYIKDDNGSTTITAKSIMGVNASNNLLIAYGLQTTGATGIYGKRIYFAPNGEAIRMLINESGNVLIGTTTDNGAKLQVNGGIYADTFINFSTNASYGVFRGNLISARLSSEDVAVASPKFYIGATCLIGDTKVVDSEARMLVYGKTYIEGDLHVTGNIIADGEVSAGGRAEEGGNAGGGGAFHSESIAVGATQTTIAHGLGTDDIVVSIYEKDGVSGRWSIILTDVEIVDANNIIVSFGSATSVEHKVVIMGAVA